MRMKKLYLIPAVILLSLLPPGRLSAEFTYGLGALYSGNQSVLSHSFNLSIPFRSKKSSNIFMMGWSVSFNEKGVYYGGPIWFGGFLMKSHTENWLSDDNSNGTNYNSLSDIIMPYIMGIIMHLMPNYFEIRFPVKPFLDLGLEIHPFDVEYNYADKKDYLCTSLTFKCQMHYKLWVITPFIDLRYVYQTATPGIQAGIKTGLYY